MYARILLAVMLVTSVLAVPVAAQEDGGGGTTIINLDGVIDAIEDLKDWVTDLVEEVENWEKKLKEIALALLFEPVRFFAQKLIEYLALLLSYTPSVEGNGAVEEIHGQTLFLAYVFAGAFFVGTGLLYMIGPIFGISYGQATATIPRLIAALMFATVSLPLLQWPIDITNELVLAFRPHQLTMELGQLLGLTAGIGLVVYIKAPLLLVVLLLYVFRAVIILFVAAVSPLVAVFWAVPRVKRYADSLITLWWWALAISPINMLVLSFIFEMLDPDIYSPIQSISNWVLGVAALVLLFFIPYHLYGASQAIVGQSLRVSEAATSSHRRRKKEKKRDEYREKRLKQNRQMARRRRRGSNPGNSLSRRGGNQ